MTSVPRLRTLVQGKEDGKTCTSRIAIGRNRFPVDVLQRPNGRLVSQKMDTVHFRSARATGGRLMAL